MAKVTYRPTGERGIYVLHEPSCPAYRWTKGTGKGQKAASKEPRCRCRPSYKGRHKGRWQPNPVRDKADVRTWLGMAAKGAKAIEARTEAGRSFGSLGEEWMSGVESGQISRRRKGKPVPYSTTTIGPYRRDLVLLADTLALGKRVAAEIEEDEWQAIVDRFRRKGLSYSRAANIKAVASSIYEWASHRTRRNTTGVMLNPLAHVDLGPNNGERRTRVALLDEAAELLAALAPKDQVPFAIAFYAGLRKQDIRRLLWEDVQMIDGKPGNWLHVRPLDGGMGPGKVGDGRWVPIVPQLRAVLLAAYIRQGRKPGQVCEVSVDSGKFMARADAAWQAANERKDGPLRPRSKREDWRPEHQLQRITLHECRHTYCSWLVASKKWDIKTIQKFMGHELLSTTERYMHEVREHGPWDDELEDVMGEAQSG